MLWDSKAYDSTFSFFLCDLLLALAVGMGELPSIKLWAILSLTLGWIFIIVFTSPSSSSNNVSNQWSLLTEVKLAPTSGGQGVNQSLSGIVERVVALPSEEERFYKRVSYTIKGPIESQYPRQLYKERLYNSTKKVVIMQWFPDPVEPISSFHLEFQRLSGCEVKVEGTHKDKKADLSPVLLGIDIVIWWNWAYDLDQLVKARKKFPHVLFVLQNWDDPSTMFYIGNIQPQKELYDIVFSSGTATLPTYMNVSPLRLYHPIDARQSCVFIPSKKEKNDRLQYVINVDKGKDYWRSDFSTSLQGI